MSLIERAFAVNIPTITPTGWNGTGGSDLTLGEIVANVAGIAFYVVGILAFIYLIYAGILYITANGNDEQAKKGQKGIINAIIGIVIVVLAITIIGVAQKLGGFDAGQNGT